MSTVAKQNLEELIQQAGYERARLRFMKLIVRCALESLAHAEARLSEEWNDFCQKDGALTRSSRPAARSRPNENAVTYELAHHVDEFLKALPSDHEYRDINFRFEKPKRSKRLAGSKLKRLDLQYEARYTEGPEFVIEAKPIFTPRDIEKGYLGDPGLGRFLRDDEPFTSGDLAALLGYVVHHELGDWVGKIKKAVVDDGRCEAVMELVSAQGQHDLYSTRHARTAVGRPIWMLHLLVTYPSIAIAV